MDRTDGAEAIGTARATPSPRSPRQRLRRRSSVALLVLALLLRPSVAAALDFHLLGEPLRLDLTESLFTAAHLDNGTSDPTDKNYGELLNRLNAQLAWRRFLFTIRFDSAAWVHTPQPGDHSPYVSPPGASPSLNCPKATTPLEQSLCVVQPNDPRLTDRFRPADQVVTRGGVPLGVTAFYMEKISLTYAGRSVEATLGDFYVNLGRGLVLSIRKVDELGVDTTISGAKLVLHEKNVSAIALAGFTNTQNIDQGRAQFTDDPNDLIAAAHVDYRFFDRLLVGANAMFGKPTLDTANPTCPMGRTCAAKPFDYYLRPGVMLDAPRLLSWLGIYAEYVREQDRIATAAREGNALYGAVNIYSKRTNWLFEAKWYDHYQVWHGSNDPFGTVVYQVPPTLEQVITQINDNSNILAGRTRLDVRVSPSLNVFASAELGRSHPSGDASQNTLVDFYGGVELRWNNGLSHFFPIVGYRNEHDDVGQTTYEELGSLSWDASQILGKGFSVETAGLIWFRKKGAEAVAGSGDNQWREGNVQLAIKWSPRFVLGAGYEFTTIAEQKYNQHDFFNGSFVWNITPGTSAQLFVGGNRPGLKCVSGVCRDFPGFEGVRLELVVRL